uniref:Uncharacterized protein n=1 Tax=Anopheles albimanus TaxID=7167 RepID=A0A182F0P7_ANOAL
MAGSGYGFQFPPTPPDVPILPAVRRQRVEKARHWQPPLSCSTRGNTTSPARPLDCQDRQ